MSYAGTEAMFSLLERPALGRPLVDGTTPRASPDIDHNAAIPLLKRPCG